MRRAWGYGVGFQTAGQAAKHVVASFVTTGFSTLDSIFEAATYIFLLLIVLWVLTCLVVGAALSAFVFYQALQGQLS